MTRKLVAASLLFLAGFASTARAEEGVRRLPPEHDLQLWADVQGTMALTRKVELGVGAMVRLGDDLHRSIYERGQVQAAIRPLLFSRLDLASQTTSARPFVISPRVARKGMPAGAGG